MQMDTQAGGPAHAAPETDDSEGLAALLTEFVRSDYARQLCDYCNAPAAEYGQVSGMFERLHLNDDKLVVKLKSAFDQRAEKLLDRLARHLRANRARIPRIRTLHEDSRTRGYSTRVL